MNILWNAHVKVENTTKKNATVGTGWGVTDDKTGPRTIYDAEITVTLPEGAHASVTKVAPQGHETVVLNSSPGLTCGPNGIEAIVTYRVSAQPGAKGSEVGVNVAIGAGEKPPPTGGVLGQATGQVGQDITVHVVIPGSCA